MHALGSIDRQGGAGSRPQGVQTRIRDPPREQDDRNALGRTAWGGDIGRDEAGAGGTDGGEHLAQPEKSARFHEDDSAGADGKPGAAGTDSRRNENGAGRNRQALDEAESTAAVQPARGARRKRCRELRSASGGGRGGGRFVARGGEAGREAAVKRFREQRQSGGER